MIVGLAVFKKDSHDFQIFLNPIKVTDNYYNGKIWFLSETIVIFGNVDWAESETEINRAGRLWKKSMVFDHFWLLFRNAKNTKNYESFGNNLQKRVHFLKQRIFNLLERFSIIGVPKIEKLFEN